MPRYKIGKAIVAGVLAVVLALALGACGGDDPAPTATTAPAAPTATAAPEAAEPTAAPATATPTPAPSEYDKIVAAAREEGTAEIWINWEEDTAAKLEAKWEQDFGWPIEIVNVAMPASAFTERIITDTAAGQPVGDMGQPSYDLMIEMVDAGVIEKVDWVGIFSERFPDISTRADVGTAELEGYALKWRDGSGYPITYNTNLVADTSELPQTWFELADPKWRGKVAIDARGYPFNFLMHSPDWPEERVWELVEALSANDPILVDKSRGVEVMAGEAHLQISGCNLNDIAAGAPIDCQVFDSLPYNPLITGSPSAAKHPNLSMLFIAWITSDEGGYPLYAVEEGQYRLADPDSLIGKKIEDAKTAGRNVDVIGPSSIENIRRSGVFRKEVGEFWAGIR